LRKYKIIILLLHKTLLNQLDMRNFVLILILIISNTVSYCQIIKGTVLDEKTKSPIGFASVYFNGTFDGTISDEKGYFELNRSKHLIMPLTISAVGYYSNMLTDFSSTKSINIYLKSKEYVLQEAVVKSKSLKALRKRYLRLFKEEFLGLSDNSLKCKILNEEDITFNYYKDKDTLRAFASKPLLIENKSLGYRVTYYLDKFEYYWKYGAIFFSGNIAFNEDDLNPENLKSYTENRKDTYWGSRMHFFRTLSLNDSIIKGFTITNSKSKLLKLRDIVVQDSSENRYLYYPNGFKITCSRGISYVNTLKKYVYFDKTGYFDGAGINWVGNMGDQRVADWLPYEYKTEK